MCKCDVESRLGGKDIEPGLPDEGSQIQNDG